MSGEEIGLAVLIVFSIFGFLFPGVPMSLKTDIERRGAMLVFAIIVLLFMAGLIIFDCIDFIVNPSTKHTRQLPLPQSITSNEKLTAYINLFGIDVEISEQKLHHKIG